MTYSQAIDCKKKGFLGVQSQHTSFASRNGHLLLWRPDTKWCFEPLFISFNPVSICSYLRPFSFLFSKNQTVLALLQELLNHPPLRTALNFIALCCSFTNNKNVTSNILYSMLVLNKGSLLRVTLFAVYSILFVIVYIVLHVCWLICPLVIDIFNSLMYSMLFLELITTTVSTTFYSIRVY